MGTSNGTPTHIPHRDAGRPEDSWWIGKARGPEWEQALAEYFARWQTARRDYKSHLLEPNRETWQ